MAVALVRVIKYNLDFRYRMLNFLEACCWEKKKKSWFRYFFLFFEKLNNCCPHFFFHYLYFLFSLFGCLVDLHTYIFFIWFVYVKPIFSYSRHLDFMSSWQILQIDYLCFSLKCIDLYYASKLCIWHHVIVHKDAHVRVILWCLGIEKVPYGNYWP